MTNFDAHDPALVQYVTLNHVEQAAVFVAPTPGDEAWPDTRVFYDLDTLIQNLKSFILPRVFDAQMTGDERTLANLAGAVWLVDNIEQSRETILLEAQFALPDAERE